MRNKLLDRVTDYFVSISEKNEATDMNKLRFSIKSILISLYRMLKSKKHLLEWME